MTLEHYLQKLTKEEVHSKHSLLVHLSALDGDEMDQFRTWWPSLPGEQRRKLIERLVTVAEDNVDMDFNGVFRHCLKDDDPRVRELAVSGLWECDDHVLLGPLMALAKDDPSDEVRISAVLGLGKFGALAESGKLLHRDGERIKDVLLSLLDNNSGSIEIRRRALEAVACFNTPRVRELIRLAYNSQEFKLQVSALYAMGRTSDPAWLTTIINETSSKETDMRYEAATACGEMGEEEVVPYLIPLIEDEDSEVQLAALKSLGAIGGLLAKRALRRCVKTGDDAIQEAAQEALQHLELEEGTLGFNS
ncbi:MAG: HEAT repeat domain-containing protein [Dehalococcoidia bacterium]|nr:HEAT repeat domain-containing protein [Dehalococcoidia bacterium]